MDGRDKPGHDGGGKRSACIGCAVDFRLRRRTCLRPRRRVRAGGFSRSRALRRRSRNAHGAGRVLLAIGIRPADVATFVAATERLGFIINPDDPRRRVIACTGSPGCASAYMPARAVAPEIAQAAASSLTDGETIHISGCAKGCALPVPRPSPLSARPTAARSSPTARRATRRSRSSPQIGYRKRLSAPCRERRHV